MKAAIKLTTGHIIATVAEIIAVSKSTGCVFRGSTFIQANLKESGGLKDFLKCMLTQIQLELLPISEQGRQRQAHHPFC